MANFVRVEPLNQPWLKKLPVITFFEDGAKNNYRHVNCRGTDKFEDGAKNKENLC